MTFAVDPALAIGSQEATIYLTGNLGVPEPMVIKVNSTSVAPDWSVNSADYEFTMNVNGQLEINGEMSQDVNDIVAASEGTDAWVWLSLLTSLAMMLTMCS